MELWTRQQLLDHIHAQAQTIARLTRQVNELQEQLAAQQKEAARSAAPFRRQHSQKIPPESQKKPGRPVGHPGVNRPTPDHIDHEIRLTLTCCPDCHGPVSDCRDHVQYIEEIPVVRPTVTKLTTQSGVCPKCGPVATTHELQTGRGHHASRVHLGPRALALAATLNKHHGLSMRKTCRVLKDACGLKLSAGGLSQALDRLADRLDKEYEQLFAEVRAGPAVYVDETSWWVGGPAHWLWVFATPMTTLYRVADSRSSAVVTETLTLDFQGVLVSDCLNIYDGGVPYEHKQKCIAHHLKAIREQLNSSGLRDRTYLESWKSLFELVCLITAKREVLGEEQFAYYRGRCEAKCAALLSQPVTQEEEIRIRNRLLKQERYLLTCLSESDVEATNNRAERALRPAVIARKISCGNKRSRGARTFERLASLSATWWQCGKNVVNELARRAGLAG